MEATNPDFEAVSLEEVIQLSAIDGIFYSHFFFPKTVRQSSPDFHKKMWKALDSPDRLVDFEVFRGGAKTTITRLYLSKRVAYAVSRTIVVVGKSQDHARRSIEWLMKQVEFNKLWAETFNLRKGNKWTSEEVEIFHGVDEVPIRAIALGITGSTRGINVDDYRPDLIVIDDPCHERGTLMLYNGKWIPVEAHPRARKGKVRAGKRIYLDGLVHPEVVTEDHKYWAAKAKYERSKVTNYNRKFVGLEAPGWVEAQDLTSEHYIGTPIEQDTCTPPQSSLPFSSPDFWYLVGLWWGDGDLSGNGNAVRWSITSDDVLAKVEEACKELGWLLHFDEGQGCIRARVGHSELWRWLHPWKVGNSMKQPYSWIMQLPRDLQHNLVRGYVDADGCVNGEGTGIRLASKYYEGLVIVSHLLARLGIRSTLRQGRKGGVHKIQGREVLAHPQFELGFTDEAALFIPGCRKPKRAFTKTVLDNGYLWRRVKKVEQVAEAEFIPLSTEDHTYITAFGLSHNCDEENTATPEQRNKTEDLILGSLLNSLAPRSESPLAKMVLLQTLLHPEDVISKCQKDPRWTSIKIPIFDENKQSAWPERWTTEELLAEKQSFMDRGKLSLWMREMECQIVSNELAAFRAQELLQYWEVLPPFEELQVVLVVDPVPPPSDREIQNGLKGKDYEAWAAVGKWTDHTRGVTKLFVLETVKMRGHDPDWSVNTFFQLLDRWHPFKVKVESVNYQRTLKWLLEKAMRRRGRFVMIDDHVPERRKKSYRIIDSIGEVLSRRELYVHRSQSDLIEAIHSYPTVAHDDEIEAVAVGLAELQNYSGPSQVSDIIEAEKDIPELEFEGFCP